MRMSLAHVAVAGTTKPSSTSITCGDASTTANSLDSDGLAIISKEPTEDAVAIFMNQDYPRGLAEEMVESRISCPLRIWVINNSGSMRLKDGRRFLGVKDKIQVVTCTRWRELQCTVEYHAELAGLIEAKTVFRMMNYPAPLVKPKEFTVVQDKGTIAQDVDQAIAIVKECEPRGSIPLSEHVREIYLRIRPMDESLRVSGHHIAVVLSTDDIPDKPVEFADDLRQLQTLPVLVVVRLCADLPKVVQYYNELKRVIKRPFVVLEEFLAEAKQISKVNPWLNYGLPLHRCREMGFHHKVFDLLKERLLDKEELLEFLRVLFGEDSLHQAPCVHTDWKGFASFLFELKKEQGKVWNPVSRKIDYWIDKKKIEKYYGESRILSLFSKSSIQK